MTPFCKSVLKNEQIIWSFYSDGEYIPQFSPKVFKRFEPKTNRAEPRLYGATWISKAISIRSNDKHVIHIFWIEAIHTLINFDA